MIKKVTWMVVALSLLGFASAFNARADDWNRKTVLTFSQAVEIPGHVLPAGTYTFKLADSLSDRHIVQVFNADGSQIIATILAIPDSRLKATDKTVITFGEVPVGSPEVIRAWFYPGDTTGNAFVYPRRRALELAKTLHAPVPAVTVDADSADVMRTAPIVDVAPDSADAPETVALRPATSTTTPVAPAASETSAAREAREARANRTARTGDESGRLPQTAGFLPLIALFGFGSAGVALVLMRRGRRS